MILLVALVVVATAPSGLAGTIGDAMVRAGDRLKNQQGGPGAWLGEEGFTGSIVAGMVNAYQVLGTAGYKTSAESGGNWILNNSVPNLYGDEAYGLTRLSAIAPDPNSNPYRTAAINFYQAVKISGGGTGGYIAGFTGTEPSNAVFYLAEHAVAANYVNAPDKAVWRQGLINFLATVENSTANYPVMSLGVATWALAQTGAMDGTYVNLSAPSSSYWLGKKLEDLPGLLAGHQVTSGDNAGSFFYRFDHTAPGGGDPSGFTEDTVFGTLGLIAADDANPALGYDDEILAARLVLASGVAGDGKVYEHIWSGGANYHAYAGETLQALPEPATLSILVAGGLLLMARRRRVR
jgi:hypothetical protein